MTIMAGDGDRVVSYRLAERLNAAISGSSLQIIQGAGHMVHHVADDQVVEAILTVVRVSGGRHLIRTPSEPRVRRGGDHTGGVCPWRHAPSLMPQTAGLRQIIHAANDKHVLRRHRTAEVARRAIRCPTLGPSASPVTSRVQLHPAKETHLIRLVAPC